MSERTTIPLSRLVPSPCNVRRRLSDIPELAACLAAKGFLQNLVVKKGTKGRYEVVAGGRRLAAAKQLVADGTWTADYIVPVQIIDGDETTVSLMENTARANMTIVEEVKAFALLAEEGRSPDAIAATFGLSPVTVRQRQKLAALHPLLLDALDEGQMTLELAQAYAVSDDQLEQLAVYEELHRSWDHEPRSVRNRLNGEAVRADSGLGALVLDAYKAADGTIRTDLFNSEVLLTDLNLVEQIKVGLLEAKKTELEASKGFNWIRIEPHYYSNGMSSRYQRVYRTGSMITDEARYDQLTDSLNMLADEINEAEEREDFDRHERLSADYDRLEEEQAALEQDIYGEIDRRYVGAVIYIGNGAVRVQDGLVAPEMIDEWKKATKQASTTAEGLEPEPDAPQTAGLSNALVGDLCATRTAALSVELSKRPDIALATIVHALLLSGRYSYSEASCCRIRSGDASFSSPTLNRDETPAFAELDGIREDLFADVPEEGLFAWVLSQAQESLLALLAKLVSLTVTAHVDEQNGYEHSQALAAALSLDMTKHWQPCATFFGRTPKAYMGQALTESGISGAEKIVSGLAKEKKAAAVDSTVDALAGSGWLPEIFRS